MGFLFFLLPFFFFVSAAVGFLFKGAGRGLHGVLDDFRM